MCWPFIRTAVSTQNPTRGKPLCTMYTDMFFYSISKQKIHTIALSKPTGFIYPFSQYIEYSQDNKDVIRQ